MGHLVIINIFELFAVISATIYFYGKPVKDKFNKYFILFLWITLFVELVFGWLPTLIEDYEPLSFLQDTIWAKNLWIYNVYIILSFALYINYFRWNIKTVVLKNILKTLSTFYILSSILNLLLSDIYFKSVSSYSFLVGSIFLLFGIALYFIEMLKSDKVLNFYKLLPFYVSIGALVYHLIVTPITIYSKYFSRDKSPEFVEVYFIILVAANVFMYSCYTFGFLVCLPWKKLYQKSRSY